MGSRDRSAVQSNGTTITTTTTTTTTTTRVSNKGNNGRAERCPDDPMGSVERRAVLTGGAGGERRGGRAERSDGHGGRRRRRVRSDRGRDGRGRRVRGAGRRGRAGRERQQPALIGSVLGVGRHVTAEVSLAEVRRWAGSVLDERVVRRLDGVEVRVELSRALFAHRFDWRFDGSRVGLVGFDTATESNGKS